MSLLLAVALAKLCYRSKGDLINPNEQQVGDLACPGIEARSRFQPCELHKEA